MARKSKKRDSSTGQAGGRKWKVSDLGRFLKNSLVAMFKGEFLLRMRVDKIFPQIAFAFFLSLCVIIFNLMVDKTLVKVEDNKKVLQELEIQHTQKTYELVQLSRRSTVSKLLRESGSKVAEPLTPATVLKSPSGKAARAARKASKAQTDEQTTQADSLDTTE